MGSERVTTGINVLDDVLAGGIQKGNLILLGGNPGCGKTIFAAQFLRNGAMEHGENGVYASFSESHEAFLENMESLGVSFKKLELEGKFRFLDMLTVKEGGVATILDMILADVHALKAKRLVIDSFSALAQAFKDRIEARIILHTILSRIVRQAKCTTLIVSETPEGERRIGLGIEEFVVDDILILRGYEVDERLFRELEIVKLRGIDIKWHKLAFTLKNGFNVFTDSPTIDPSQAESKDFEVIPNTETHYSTGIAALDNILGGGFRRGSYVLEEVATDVPSENLHALNAAIVLNYMYNGGGVVSFPRGGIGPDQVEQSITPFLKRGVELKNVYRMIVSEKTHWNRPYVVPLKEASVESLAEARAKAEEELRSLTGKWPLIILGLDSYAAEISRGDVSIEHLRTSLAVKRTVARGSLQLTIARLGQRSVVGLSGMVNYHFRLFSKAGCVFFYGIKPRTELFAVQPSAEKKHISLTLVPVH